MLLGPLDDAVDHALPVAFSRPSCRRRDGLAGDDAPDGLLLAEPTMFMYVSIIHTIVCALVPTSGAGMSYSGPMFCAERVGEAARDALELGLGVQARVELDAALAAAERDVVQRRLPRHHRRERLDLVERDVLVVADAALERAEDVVVLDAVALEELERPVVHADGEVDDELVLRLRQDERGVARQVHRPGSLLELHLDDGVQVPLLLLGRLVGFGFDGGRGRGRLGDDGDRRLRRRIFL